MSETQIRARHCTPSLRGRHKRSRSRPGSESGRAIWRQVPAIVLFKVLLGVYIQLYADTYSRPPNLVQSSGNSWRLAQHARAMGCIAAAGRRPSKGVIERSSPLISSCTQRPVCLLFLWLAGAAVASAWKLQAATNTPPPLTSPFKPPPPFCTEPAPSQCLQQTTMSASGQMLRVYHNLYFHNQKLFAVMDAQQLQQILSEAATEASQSTGCSSEPSNSSCAAVRGVGAAADAPEGTSDTTEHSNDAGSSSNCNSSSSSGGCRSSSSAGSDISRGSSSSRGGGGGGTGGSSKSSRGGGGGSGSSKSCAMDPDSLIDLRPSINKGIQPLPVADVAAFTANLQMCCIPGVTLMLDFPFNAFPDNLGYWAELLLPLYSVLRQPGWRQYINGSNSGTIQIDRVMLTNVQKALYDWPQQVLRLALQAAMVNTTASSSSSGLPLLFEERELSSYCNAGWVSFENLLVIKDRHWEYANTEQRRTAVYQPAVTGQPSMFDRSELAVGFKQPADYAAFREAAHQQQLWPLLPAGKIPKVATLLMYPEGYPDIVNHRALVELLQDMLQPRGFKVRVVSLTMEAPFVSHLAAVSHSQLLVGRHGPLLASAALLPPGAALLELLPYKWDWRDIALMYRNITLSTGVLHYRSWRPSNVKWCRYQDGSDARFANWTSQECITRSCLLAHARAGLEVDLAAVQQLLEQLLVEL